MSLIVRQLESGDFENWRELWTAYLDFYRTRLDDTVYESTWKQLLGGAYYDARGLIAELDGKPVGLAHYLFQRHSWRIENVTYLQDLYTIPNVRGQGVGRALIETVYRLADDAGCPNVYWTTERDNEVARRLYDKVGTLTKFIKYQR